MTIAETILLLWRENPAPMCCLNVFLLVALIVYAVGAASRMNEHDRRHK